MMNEETERRFEAVETKLAYLEDFLVRLQEAVLARNEAADKKAAEIAAIKDKVVELAGLMEEMPHQRPPHY